MEENREMMNGEQAQTTPTPEETADRAESCLPRKK